MSLPTGSEEVLLAEGWRKVLGGPYLAAWEQFWGKDLELNIQQPWKAWDSAISKPSQNGSLEDSIRDSTRIVFGDGIDVALPSCTFINTPWTEELINTKGRIMVAEGYNHIYGRIQDAHAERPSSGVIVEGQNGIGKTYLSFYLLTVRLSTEQPVIYSPHARCFIFFHAGGVLESNTLQDSWFNDSDFREALPKSTWTILDAGVDDGEPPDGATEGHLYSILLCRPHEKYFSDWKRRSMPDMLVLDLPSPPTILAGALIQDKIRNRKEDFARLLSMIRDFGPCSRYCFLGATRRLDLYASIRSYLSGLSLANAQRYPVLATRSYQFPDCLRSDDGPDIFALRRDYRDLSTEVMLPVIASRHVMGELRKRFAFSDLYCFRKMAVIREPPDDMEQTRLWLFEHLCHALFSEGDRHDSGFADLNPCFADHTGDQLLLEHIFRARSVQSLESDLPLDASPEAYFVVRDLGDTTFHALSYLTPYSKRKRAVMNSDAHRAVTRGLAKQLASSTQIPQSTPARVTRSSKRVHKPISPALTRPPAKRPRLKADKRFVVVYQMLLDGEPVLSTGGLERLERMKSADPYAQYYFVFVTLSGQNLDKGRIPQAFIAQFRWYHLAISLDLHAYR